MSIELNVLWLLKPLSRHAGKLEDVASHIVRSGRLVLSMEPAIAFMRQRRISSLESDIGVWCARSRSGLPFWYIDPYWFCAAKKKTAFANKWKTRSKKKKEWTYSINRCCFGPKKHAFRKKVSNVIVFVDTKHFLWFFFSLNHKTIKSKTNSSYLRIAWKIQRFFFHFLEKNSCFQFWIEMRTF